MRRRDRGEHEHGPYRTRASSHHLIHTAVTHDSCRAEAVKTEAAGPNCRAAQDSLGGPAACNQKEALAVPEYEPVKFDPPPPVAPPVTDDL